MSFEPKVQKELHRFKSRAIKQKCIEAINRKLDWDRQQPGSARQIGFKGFMCSAWRGQGPRLGGRWMNANSLGSDKIGTERNNNGGIEEVELSAFDKLWGKDGFYELLRARSRAFRHDLNDLNSSIFSSHSFGSSHERGDAPPASENHQESDIKASQSRHKTRHSADSDPEYDIDPITNRKVFKNYPRDNNRRPIDVPVKTFKGYRSQFTDFEPPKPEIPKPNSKLTQINDHNSQHTKSDSTRECLRDYESTETYQPYFAYEPDGEKPGEKKPDGVQDGLKEFDRRASYRWSSWFNSPEKIITEKPVEACPVQEGLKDYDNRTSYEASPWNEPESKIPVHTQHSHSTQQGLNDFDSIACYGPLKSSTDSTSSKATFVYPSHDRGLEDFDEKTSYGPVMYNEPDGKVAIKSDMVADCLHEFDRKADYGQRRILKNISLSHGSSKTDKSFRYLKDIDTREDLDLLRPSDIRAASGIIKGVKKESEADKLARRQELEEDFQKSQQFETSYIDKTSAVEPEKETRNVSESKSAKGSARKLTGNFARDFPEEFNTSWTNSKDASGSLSPKQQTDAWGYDKDPKALELSYQQEVENDIQKAEKEYIDGRASKEAFARNPDTPRLQTSLDRKSYQEETNSIKTFQAEADPYSKRPQGLETSYAEECKVQSEVDPYSKEPQGLETSYANECALNQGEGDLSASVSSYSTPNPKEVSQEAALVRELQRIYEDKYGTIDLIHRQASEASSPAQPVDVDTAEALKSNSDKQEPTAYKILAYDPTMQSISIAETTSIVPDSASTLTPAEVLLRLSNPTKFFPHFQPLQAEGYEIVSGSGDVLVFRKVRMAGPPGMKSESSTSYQDRTRKTTNPIDGMQSRPVAATGNFASPTGFVNYDRPVPSDPPFKSNIDVRREEPVFSGKSSWSEGAEAPKRKRPSLAKRVLVGSAMVGGCSYAIGVVAEYFKSGGADGLGPQTF